MPHPVVQNAMLENSDMTVKQVSSRAVLAVIDSTMTFSEAALAASKASTARGKVTNLFGESNKIEEEYPLAVVTADAQTAGVGRLGRIWANQTGKSFAGSFIATLPSPVLEALGAGWLTTMAGLSVIEALADISPNTAVKLKWPNDLFVDGKKLGGILSRLVPPNPAEQMDILIFGIGLNLFMEPEELPIEAATSLHLLLKNDLATATISEDTSAPAASPASYIALRERLVESIAASLRRWLQRICSDPVLARQALLNRAREQSATLGKPAHVRLTGGEAFSGMAVSIDEDAALTVQLDDGTMRRVTTGDVGIDAAEMNETDLSEGEQ